MRLPALVLILALAASVAHAAGLDLPVWRDGMGPAPTAFYRGDVLETFVRSLVPKVTFVDNPEWQTNNVLLSMACARRYFDQPSETELLSMDRELRTEIAERLARVTGLALDAGHPDELWAALERWAGRENLEVRMVRPGSIDRMVLGVLREETGG